MVDTVIKSRSRRQGVDKLFVALCIVAASLSMVVLIVLMSSILSQGWSGFTLDFIKGSPSRKAEEAGIWPAMWGTIFICLICGLSAVPIGVGTAIFLEDFKPRQPWVKKLHAFVQLNITNLAGVPSVVYGILGLTLFVQAFNWVTVFGTPADPAFVVGATYFDEVIDESGQYLRYPTSRSAEPVVAADGQTWTDMDGKAIAINVVTRPELIAINKTVRAEQKALDAETGLSDEERQARSDAIEKRALAGVIVLGAEPDRVNEKAWYYFQVPMDRSIMAGGLTLMLVVLPVVIIAAQESLRAVPDSLRQGALALGCTRWQTVWNMSLPSAIPGIMTGTILAMSRAIGEAAPILIIAGIVYITFTPQHLMDEFTAMPLQIYNWASRPQEEFHRVAASGIILLLAILLTFNALAVFIRYKFQKPLS